MAAVARGLCLHFSAKHSAAVFGIRSHSTEEKQHTMISSSDIKGIVERRAAGCPVLSVYLDVDQSKAGNLNRRFEVSLNDMLRFIEARLDGKQLQGFR